ncbi:hypothetical protein IRJ41_007972 [Triplophysa rosa]|uniref:Secreted protein n=1 Tax=Triplophysa rosa TaxID=992332 RepID=A0A9W7TLS4_TRIRA|nr:hypothetical protein IRJ41_007972 [Triplophysa rosa]
MAGTSHRLSLLTLLTSVTDTVYTVWTANHVSGRTQIYNTKPLMHTVFCSKRKRGNRNRGEELASCLIRSEPLRAGERSGESRSLA